MVMDSAAIGAVFLICLLVSALLGDARAMTLMDPQFLAVLGAAGAFGVGATITLIGSSVWSLFFPYEADETHLGPIRRGARGTRKLWSERLIPDDHRMTSIVIGGESVARTALLATSLVIYCEAKPEFIQFLRRRHQGFASGLNVVAAIALGNLAAFAFATVVSPARLAWIAGWLLLASVIVRAGFRQRREAEDVERLWFEARARANAEG